MLEKIQNGRYIGKAFASLKNAFDEVKINENYEVEYIQTDLFWDKT